MFPRIFGSILSLLGPTVRHEPKPKLCKVSQHERRLSRRCLSRKWGKQNYMAKYRENKWKSMKIWEKKWKRNSTIQWMEWGAIFLGPFKLDVYGFLLNMYVQERNVGCVLTCWFQFCCSLFGEHIQDVSTLLTCFSLSKHAIDTG